MTRSIKKGLYIDEGLLKKIAGKNPLQTPMIKTWRRACQISPEMVGFVFGVYNGKVHVEVLVTEDIAILDFLAKRAGFPIKKLLLSAVANALQVGIEKKNLFIKELRVDKGIVMKRMMPAAMGTGHRINKRTSHLALVLAEKLQPVKVKSDKKEVNKKGTLRVSPR